MRAIGAVTLRPLVVVCKVPRRIPRWKANDSKLPFMSKKVTVCVFFRNLIFLDMLVLVQPKTWSKFCLFPKHKRLVFYCRFLFYLKLYLFLVDHSNKKKKYYQTERVCCLFKF